MTKEDFLPIPDAPMYEINSQLICRSCKTKKTLTLQTDYKNFRYYSLHPYPGKPTIKRSQKTLRLQAVAAMKESTFEPIPSLNGKYEINTRGVVRNAQSKRILKPKNYTIEFHLGKRQFIRRAVAGLLWEVHGTIKPRRFRPQPCSAENQHGKHFFPSMKACARFLVTKLFYASCTIAIRLNRREENIGGWKITYIARELYDKDNIITSIKGREKIF